MLSRRSSVGGSTLFWLGQGDQMPKTVVTAYSLSMPDCSVTRLLFHGW